MPLVAYDATFRVAGPSGERMVRAAEYFTLPETNVRTENVLASNELLTHVIRPAAGGIRSGHNEGRSKARDWPIAFATVLLAMNGMRALTSPKITVGVHCLKLRTNGVYAQTTVDPDEAAFYDRCDSCAYRCTTTQTGFGPDGNPVRLTPAATSAGALSTDGTPDDVGTVGALLMGPDACITGSDYLMNGGVTAAYWFGELAAR